jgi:hypothetical protein
VARGDHKRSYLLEVMRAMRHITDARDIVKGPTKGSIRKGPAEGAPKRVPHCGVSLDADLVVCGNVGGGLLECDHELVFGSWTVPCMQDSLEVEVRGVVRKNQGDGLQSRHSLILTLAVKVEACPRI